MYVTQCIEEKEKRSRDNKKSVEKRDDTNKEIEKILK
jgi:hypothetical protein